MEAVIQHFRKKACEKYAIDLETRHHTIVEEPNAKRKTFAQNNLVRYGKRQKAAASHIADMTRAHTHANKIKMME